jgi:hypothetical protein
MPTTPRSGGKPYRVVCGANSLSSFVASRNYKRLPLSANEVHELSHLADFELRGVWWPYIQGHSVVGKTVRFAGSLQLQQPIVVPQDTHGQSTDMHNCIGILRVDPLLRSGFFLDMNDWCR